MKGEAGVMELGQLGLLDERERERTVKDASAASTRSESINFGRFDDVDEVSGGASRGHVSLSMGGFDGQRHGHLATEQTGTANRWQQGLTSH